MPWNRTNNIQETKFPEIQSIIKQVQLTINTQIKSRTDIVN